MHQVFSDVNFFNIISNFNKTAKTIVQCNIYTALPIKSWLQTSRLLKQHDNESDETLWHVVACCIQASHACMLRPSVYCHSGTEVRSEAASSSVDCPSGPSVRVSGHTPMKRVQSTCIDGVNALLLTEAKSIAGCSKYSIKIGVNVAIETVRG